jgi:hypothetical protein
MPPVGDHGVPRGVGVKDDAQPVLAGVDVRREQVVADEHPVARGDVEVVRVGRNAAGQRPLRVHLEHRHVLLGEHRGVGDRPRDDRLRLRRGGGLRERLACQRGVAEQRERAAGAQPLQETAPSGTWE